MSKVEVLIVCLPICFYALHRVPLLQSPKVTDLLSTTDCHLEKQRVVQMQCKISPVLHLGGEAGR